MIIDRGKLEKERRGATKINLELAQVLEEIYCPPPKSRMTVPYVEKKKEKNSKVTVYLKEQSYRRA